MLENPQDPSTTRIVCDLPPREGSKGSDYFSLILKVDGEEVPNKFAVRYLLANTPLVRKVRTNIFINNFIVSLNVLPITQRHFVSNLLLMS